MARLLIAYATVEGHSAKIAECMRDALEHQADEVQLLEVCAGDEELPAEIDAVIVGGSIHMGHHKKELVTFAAANRTRLEELPTGFFTVCLGALDDSEEGRTATAGYARAFCEATGWTAPTIAVFPGRLAWTEYDYFTRLVMKLITRHQGNPDRDVHRDYDYTDYEAVRRFAVEVAGATRSAAVI